MIPLPTFTLLCGPKGSGKTTLSRLLQEQDSGLCLMSFAEPIRMALLATFHPEEMTLGLDLRQEDVKSRLIPNTNVTYRKWMMEFGDWMKSIHNPYIFADIAKRTISSQSPYWQRFIFDDCRFLEEVVGLINANMGEVMVVHLERRGTVTTNTVNLADQFGVTGNQGTVITGPNFPIPNSRRLAITNNGEPADMLAQMENLLCPPPSRLSSPSTSTLQ